MEIIVDCLGGEKEPAFLIKGGLQAAKDFNVRVAFSGIPELIERVIADSGCALDQFRIIPAYQKVGMDEDPYEAFTAKPDSSIAAAIRELIGHPERAVVSPGHTGATVVCSHEYLGFFSQVKKPAICQMLPAWKSKKFCLLDVGASPNISGKDFVAFAIMGHCVAEKLLGINTPRIGLLNIGSENSKGSKKLQRAGKSLSQTKLNYVGNVEGDQIWFGSADVVVTEGITGNILLKSSEGLARLLINTFKSSSPDSNSNHFSQFDSSHYGGAPLLGIKGHCVVCHGRAGDREIYQAINVALKCIQINLASCIENALINFAENRSFPWKRGS